MDERQTKITEGAGLEESRVNRELIETLQRWSTPVLLVLLAVAGLYAGAQWYDRYQIQKLDEAFLDYQEAELEARPDRLLEVASEHSGRAAIEELATLTAADLHLQAYHMRIRPGTLGVSAEDRLDAEEAQEMLARADDLYRQAYDEAKGRSGQELLTIGARWGTVAVAMTERRWDDASAGLEEIASIAERAGYDDLEQRARDLIESIPDLQSQREPVVEIPRPVAGEQTPEGDSGPADQQPDQQPEEEAGDQPDGASGEPSGEPDTDG